LPVWWLDKLWEVDEFATPASVNNIYIWPGGKGEGETGSNTHWSHLFFWFGRKCSAARQCQCQKSDFRLKALQKYLDNSISES